MQLIVGTNSTWSLRAWICGRIAELDLAVSVIDLQKPECKEELKRVSTTGLVPVLLAGELQIHDSLAIAEYFNELSNGALYPSNQAERAIARSLVSELHSGFIAVRSACPFSLEPVSPASFQAESLISELARIEEIFASARLPYMFDKPSAVDAFYAVMAYRLNGYGIHLNGKAGEYQNSLLKWAALIDAIETMHEWSSAANV